LWGEIQTPIQTEFIRWRIVFDGSPFSTQRKAWLGTDTQVVFELHDPTDFTLLLGNGQGDQQLSDVLPDLNDLWVENGVNDLIFESYSAPGNSQRWRMVLNGVELTTDNGGTGIRDYYISRVGSRDDNPGNSSEGKLMRLQIWDNGGIIGNTVAELADYQFTEAGGLVVENRAANAPANSDLLFNLQGSPAGTQWTISQYQEPHNIVESKINLNPYSTAKLNNLGWLNEWLSYSDMLNKSDLFKKVSNGEISDILIYEDVNNSEATEKATEIKEWLNQ
jgi:hypothetical protein